MTPAKSGVARGHETFFAATVFGFRAIRTMTESLFHKHLIHLNWTAKWTSGRTLRFRLTVQMERPSRDGKCRNLQAESGSRMSSEALAGRGCR